MSHLKDVQPGDTVRLLHENGDFAVVKVVSTGRCAVFASGDTWFDTTNGWTITDIERPKPELPTEPGWYKSGTDGSGGELLLSQGCEWWWVGNRYAVNGAPLTAVGVAAHMPLTRLDPVTVTAKKVIERLASSWEFGVSTLAASVLDEIAAEFGVES